MKKTSRKRATRIGVCSALAGGAVGFALGMLFAPKRGPDARRRIAYQIERLLQSGGESEARRNSDAVVEDAEARADHIRDDIDALMEELRQASQADDDGGTGAV